MNNRLIISDGISNCKGSYIIKNLAENIYIYNIIIKNNNLYHNNKILNLNNVKLVIFDFNEDLFTYNLNWDPRLKKFFSNCNQMIIYFIKISNYIKQSYNNIIIYNDPYKCFILGNKYNVFNKIKHINNNIFGIPKYKNILDENDIYKIDFFPVILKYSNGSHTNNDTICKNKNELINTYNTVFKFKKNIICIEYITSYINELNCNHSIRLMVTNNQMIDYYMRPSKKWNIHNDDQDSSKIYISDNYLKNFILQNKVEINKYLNKIYNIFGCGFYAYDLILNNNKLYICEIGLKIYDDSYVNFINNNNIKLKKITLYPEKLRKLYDKILNSNFIK